MERSRTDRIAGRMLTACSLGLALILLLFTPRAAMGHAGVKSSTPADGSTAQAGLTLITIIFEEEIGVDQSSADLIGPDGKVVSGVTAAVNRAERTRMTIQTPPLTSGRYTVNWKAFSEDDNNLAAGTLNFTVAGSGETGAPGTQPANEPSSSTPPGGTTSGSLPTAGAGDNLLSLALALALAMCLLALGCAIRRREIG